MIKRKPKVCEWQKRVYPGIFVWYTKCGAISHWTTDNVIPSGDCINCGNKIKIVEHKLKPGPRPCTHCGGNGWEP